MSYKYSYSILNIFEYIAVTVLSILGIVIIIYLTKFGWETIFFSIPIYCLVEWLLLVIVDL